MLGPLLKEVRCKKYSQLYFFDNLTQQQVNPLWLLICKFQPSVGKTVRFPVGVVWVVEVEGVVRAVRVQIHDVT